MSLFGETLRHCRVRVTRTGLAILCAAALAGLGACTTLEGNNALTSLDTFEDEVLVGTLQGIGIVPREDSNPQIGGRAPLVMPGNTAALPQPTQDNSELFIPTDSDQVTIDTAGLTNEDLRLLGRVRVVEEDDPYANRLPEEREFRRMVEQMQAYRGMQTGQRPIDMPPERYFTTVDEDELVCLAANGDLVSISDPACPSSIRQALLNRQGN